jgi:hypothetical protein
MPIFDLVNEPVTGTSFAAQNITQATTGTAVDLQNSQIDTAVVLDFNIANTNITNVYVQLEECATTGGTFTVIPAVGGGNMVYTATTNPVANVMKGLRTQRYARANVVTAQGTTVSLYVNARIFGQSKFTPSSVAGVQGGYSRAPSA